MKSRFTTCVCNCRRIDKLPQVLASLGNDHEIVVATYCGSPQHSKVVAEVCPGVEHFCALEDLGCNRLWRQAISMAKTKWISLLYDDDKRPPGFAAEAEKLIDQIEAAGAGWGAWNAQAYHWSDNSLRNSMTIAHGKAGIHPSAPLISRISTKGRFADSPVSFLFDKETCLDVLAWCQENISDCQTRPGMMVGNDLALFLGHILRFPTMVQSDKILSYYGNWPGSETCAYFTRQSSSLMVQYEKARARLMAAGPSFPPSRKDES